MREFMHVDDCADAIVFLLERIDADDLYSLGLSHLNIGTGTDIKILKLAEMIRELVGFHGEIRFDDSKPDGTPRKLLDVSRLAELGWRYRTELKDGLRLTIDWYTANMETARYRETAPQI
jgi:GDP-L-fucose synthase